jgi:hypothetical protein
LGKKTATAVFFFFCGKPRTVATVTGEQRQSQLSFSFFGQTLWVKRQPWLSFFGIGNAGPPTGGRTKTNG